MRARGGIGRHAGLRNQCLGVQVRVLPCALGTQKAPDRVARGYLLLLRLVDHF